MIFKEKLSGRINLDCFLFWNAFSDQDRDSSASSSKSPGAMQLHTQHFFPQQSSDRTDSNDFVPPTTIAATTATDESDQPRRMYVREQFTHENTVRGNVAEPGENIIRR